MKIEKTDYGRAITACVADYPGASVSFERGGKHFKAILSFAGQTRKVSFPASPRDSRCGPLNCCQNVRGTLRQMGAVRNA